MRGTGDQRPVNAPTPQSVAALHAEYCHLTGQEISLRFDRERAWYEWEKAGFGQDDLRAVILHLKREIRDGKRNLGALKLSNILQPDRFEEDLGVARLARNLRRSGGFGAKPPASVSREPQGWREKLASLYPGAPVPGLFADLPPDVRRAISGGSPP